MQPVEVFETLRILIVEDDREIRDMLARVLASTGATVETAATGSDATSVLAKQDYDVVLADWNLRDMPDGALLTALEQSRPSLRGKTIVMTGELVERENGHAAQDAGYRFLAKPFRPSALLGEIRSITGTHNS